MRMPLPTHCASMKFGLLSLTTIPPAGSGAVLYKVPAQHQRALPAGLRIVTGAAADLAKDGARVKPARCRVVRVDLEEHGTLPEPREPAQMQIEQAARDTASTPGARDPDREDFRFIAGAVGGDVAVGEKLLEFVLAPAAIERGRVDDRECARIARRRRGQRRFGAREQ